MTPFFSASRRTFPHFEKNTKLQPGPSGRCHQLWSPGCGLGGCHPQLELCLGFKSPDCLLLHKFCPPRLVSGVAGGGSLLTDTASQLLCLRLCSSAEKLSTGQHRHRRHYRGEHVAPATYWGLLAIVEADLNSIFFCIKCLLPHAYLRPWDSPEHT